MKPLKAPQDLYSVVTTILGVCPLCGEMVRDRRYSKLRWGFASHIYRLSSRSVTMRCKQCGVRFTVTFHALASALRRRAQQAADKERERYEAWADYIVGIAAPEGRGCKKSAEES